MTFLQHTTIRCVYNGTHNRIFHQPILPRFATAFRKTRPYVVLICGLFRALSVSYARNESYSTTNSDIPNLYFGIGQFVWTNAYLKLCFWYFYNLRLHWAKSPTKVSTWYERIVSVYTFESQNGALGLIGLSDPNHPKNPFGTVDPLRTPLRRFTLLTGVSTTKYNLRLTYNIL